MRITMMIGRASADATLSVVGRYSAYIASMDAMKFAPAPLLRIDAGGLINTISYPCIGMNSTRCRR